MNEKVLIALKALEADPSLQTRLSKCRDLHEVYALLANQLKDLSFDAFQTALEDIRKQANISDSVLDTVAAGAAAPGYHINILDQIPKPPTK